MNYVKQMLLRWFLLLQAASCSLDWWSYCQASGRHLITLLFSHLIWVVRCLAGSWMRHRCRLQRQSLRLRQNHMSVHPVVIVLKYSRHAVQCSPHGGIYVLLEGWLWFFALEVRKYNAIFKLLNQRCWKFPHFLSQMQSLKITMS